MTIRTRRAFRTLLFFIILALSGVTGGKPSLAQTGGEIYFPETGHRVTGEFFSAFQAAPEPLLLYGYPITEAYADPVTGRIVQYFQRMRFELHPEEPAGEHVQLTPLGTYLYTPGEELPLPGGAAACRSFEDGEIQVCYSFLDFFDAYGGEEQFGRPISNIESHDERIVQYFERARLEWRPERPAGQRVVLTDLGVRYFNLLKENRNRLEPASANNMLVTVLELKASVFPALPVSGRTGEQTVFVSVRDQNNRPLAGARVELVVTPPGGDGVHYGLEATDPRGLTQITFPFSARQVGLVQMKVEIRYQDMSEQQEASFRAWW